MTNESVPILQTSHCDTRHNLDYSTITGEAVITSDSLEQILVELATIEALGTKA
jgi:hypothetical protein